MTSTSSSTTKSDPALLALAARAVLSPTPAHLEALSEALAVLRGPALAAALADSSALAHAHGRLDALKPVLLAHSDRLDADVSHVAFAPLPGRGRTAAARLHHAGLLDLTLDWSKAL